MVNSTAKNQMGVLMLKMDSVTPRKLLTAHMRYPSIVYTFAEDEVTV